MTDDEKLVILQQMTGEKNAAVLSAYLSLAKGAVLAHAYPFGGMEEIPPKYDTVHIEIAVYMLNKRGAEGEVSHSENGVSRTYADGDIPPALLRRITPMAGVLSAGEPDDGCSCEGRMTSDHRLLTGRDAEGQHPIQAVSGLSDALARIPRPMSAGELKEILEGGT